MKIEIETIRRRDVDLAVTKDNGEIKRYNATIVNSHGLLGLEYPNELSLMMMRNPRESKTFSDKLIGAIRQSLK